MINANNGEVLSRQKILDNVRFALLNSKNIGDHIKIRDFLDMAVIPIMFFEKGTISVAKYMLDFFNISLKELKDAAYVNTKNATFQVFSMEKILGLPEADVPMLVATNREKHYGASVMMFEEQLIRAALYLDDDVWVIPSSIHEVILLPYSRFSDGIYIAKMIQEVNRNEITEDERLGDFPYLYRRDLHCIDTFDELYPSDNGTCS